MTALSPGSNEADRSEFPPMFLSGFLRFFFRMVSVFWFPPGSTRAFRLLFSQLNKRKFSNNQLYQVEMSPSVFSLFHKHCKSLTNLYSNFLSLKGWVVAGATCFSNNMVSTKSPPYSFLFSHPFAFCLTWCPSTGLPTTPSANQCDKHQTRMNAPDVEKGRCFGFLDVVSIFQMFDFI